MPREARDHEHRLALDGGPDGLDVQRRVVAEAPAWLSPGRPAAGRDRSRSGGADGRAASPRPGWRSPWRPTTRSAAPSWSVAAERPATRSAGRAATAVVATASRARRPAGRPGRPPRPGRAPRGRRASRRRPCRRRRAPNSEARTSSSASCCTTPVAALSACTAAAPGEQQREQGPQHRRRHGDRGQRGAQQQHPDARTRLQAVEPHRDSEGAASAPNPSAPLATPYAVSGVHQPVQEPRAISTRVTPDGGEDQVEQRHERPATGGSARTARTVAQVPPRRVGGTRARPVPAGRRPAGTSAAAVAGERERGDQRPARPAAPRRTPGRPRTTRPRW